jgi:hypothetical protein
MDKLIKGKIYDQLEKSHYSIDDDMKKIFI